jgi:hypothetical protein
MLLEKGLEDFLLQRPHDFPLPFPRVPPSGQVQKPVDSVAKELFLWVKPPGTGLLFGYGRAKKDFPVLKGEHIGGFRDAVELVVHPAHFLRGNQGDLDPWGQPSPLG